VLPRMPCPQYKITLAPLQSQVMFYKRRIEVSNLNTAEALVMGLTESFFKINIYLQNVPLHGNTTFSSIHVIHCLFVWSVIGTTSRDL
jgi:hypothetical protein